MKFKLAKPRSRVAIDQYLGNVESRSRRHQMSADWITGSWNQASRSPTPSHLSRIGAMLTDAMHGEDSPYSYSCAVAVAHDGMESHAYVTVVRRPPTHVIPFSMVITWPLTSADRSKIGAILKRDARLTYELLVHDAARPHAHVVFTIRP